MLSEENDHELTQRLLAEEWKGIAEAYLALPSDKRAIFVAGLTPAQHKKLEQAVKAIS